MNKQIFYILILLIAANSTYGQKLQQITFNESTDYFPVWPPDSKVIYFESNREKNQFEIWKYTFQDSSMVKITEGFDVHMSDISIDGKYLVFKSEKDKSLWKLLLAESKFTKLTNDKYNNGRPSISKDYKYITYNSNRNGKDDIWQITFSGDSIKRLTKNNDKYHSMDWSPDGKWIVYSTGEWGNRKIWLLSVETLESELIIDMQGNNCLPKWSPDGNKIAFYSDTNGNKDIWYYDLRLKSYTQVTFHKSNDVCPEWCPDGRKITFASNRTGNMEIWIIKLN